MSLIYLDHNSAEHRIAGISPGGNIEMGAVSTRKGAADFGDVPANDSKTYNVTFTEPFDDANYAVDLTLSSYQVYVTVTDKTASGFTLYARNTYGTQLPVTVTWYAFKLYTVAEAEQLASAVDDIEAMIPASASSSNKFATASDLRTETRTLDRRIDDVEDVIPSDATISNKLATAEDVAEAMANAGLKVTDTIPASPDDGDVLLYIGTEEGFTKGGIYQYSAAQDEWILISTADVDLSHYETSWTGTKAEWDALTSAEKKKYQLANITDDVIGGEVADEVTDGLMSPVTSNSVYDYPIDSIADGQHRPPTSNAVYDALALKQGVIKSKTIQNATTEQYYNAIALGLTSTQIPVSAKATSGNIIAFLMTCAGTWYLAVYENKTDGYKTPVYNTNIGTLTVYYFEI